MPDYAERPDIEAKLATALEVPFADARQKIDAGEAINWPAFTAMVETRTRDEIEAAFVLVMLLMMATDSLDPTSLAMAKSWSGSASRRLALGIAQNSQTALAGGATSLQVFPSSRVLSIATTTTTQTITAAETAARSRRIEQGEVPRPARIPPPVGPLSIPDGLIITWVAEPGACSICAPLHGKEYDSWAHLFPEGPPSPHPNCRCSLRYDPI